MGAGTGAGVEHGKMFQKTILEEQVPHDGITLEPADTVQSASLK